MSHVLTSRLTFVVPLDHVLTIKVQRIDGPWGRGGAAKEARGTQNRMDDRTDDSSNECVSQKRYQKHQIEEGENATLLRAGGAPDQPPAALPSVYLTERAQHAHACLHARPSPPAIPKPRHRPANPPPDSVPSVENPGQIAAPDASRSIPRAPHGPSIS